MNIYQEGLLTSLRPERTEVTYEGVKFFFWDIRAKDAKSLNGLSLRVNPNDEYLYNLLRIIPFYDVSMLYLGNEWGPCYDIVKIWVDSRNELLDKLKKEGETNAT